MRRGLKDRKAITLGVALALVYVGTIFLIRHLNVWQEHFFDDGLKPALYHFAYGCLLCLIVPLCLSVGYLFHRGLKIDPISSRNSAFAGVHYFFCGSAIFFLLGTLLGELGLLHRIGLTILTASFLLIPGPAITDSFSSIKSVRFPRLLLFLAPL